MSLDKVEGKKYLLKRGASVGDFSSDYEKRVYVNDEGLCFGSEKNFHRASRRRRLEMKLLSCSMLQKKKL